jgi:hypothetical protein
MILFTKTNLLGPIHSNKRKKTGVYKHIRL